MQQFRQEDILQVYYPHSFTFSREDIDELNDDTDYANEIPNELCDPEKNELFIKSKVYYEANNDQEILRYYKKDGSPQKRSDWRSEARDFKTKQDDVRLRDRHHYKKKEKKKEEIAVWALPPQ